MTAVSNQPLTAKLIREVVRPKVAKVPKTDPTLDDVRVWIAKLEHFVEGTSVSRDALPLLSLLKQLVEKNMPETVAENT